jgi:hypothetical protein
VNDGFGAASAVAVLATPGVQETPTWISADGCTVFLQSSRDGTMKIFSATRPK